MAPAKSLDIDPQRKWELVSALQKSIRRGDRQIAIRLISAMDNKPTEYAYFWRRLCVIACEDVGPADDTLAAFVVACSTIFAKKRSGPKNHDLFCFLSEQMCALLRDTYSEGKVRARWYPTSREQRARYGAPAGSREGKKINDPMSDRLH